MIPIPAIDIRDGKVVRLSRGDFKEEKVYFDRPEDVALRFEREGAKRLHVVDLDGALGGMPKNAEHIQRIVDAVRIPVEVGGGIRRLETAKFYVNLGVSWVILGTKACLDKGFLEEALSAFKDKVIIGLDALKGYVATDGWTKVTKIHAIDLAKTIQALGGRSIIYTDIDKDGVLGGPNLPEIKRFSEALTIDVIASGGIGSLKDLSDIRALGKDNICGVIIGKALYEKKFSLKEAILTCSPNE